MASGHQEAAGRCLGNVGRRSLTISPVDRGGVVAQGSVRIGVTKRSYVSGKRRALGRAETRPGGRQSRVAYQDLAGDGGLAAALVADDHRSAVGSFFRIGNQVVGINRESVGGQQLHEAGGGMRLAVAVIPSDGGAV